MAVDLKIIYEDDSIVIFNKPQGIPTAPGVKNSFCEKVYEFYPSLKSVKGYKINEGGLLNRLDNETGGLLLFAKNDDSFKYYSNQMNEFNIKKTYHAVVDGIPLENHGIIDCPVAHHYSDKKRMVCVNGKIKYRGKPREAATHWKLIDSKNNFSLLEIQINKGARHQIRVHLAFVGMPIAGDKLYNKNNAKKFDYHLLYSTGVEFLSYNKEKIAVLIDVPFSI